MTLVLWTFTHSKILQNNNNRGNRGSFQRVQGAAVFGGLFGVSAVGWGFWVFFRVPPFWLKSISTDFGLLPRWRWCRTLWSKANAFNCEGQKVVRQRSENGQVLFDTSRQAQPWMLDGGIWCKKAEIREPRSSCAVEVVCNEMKRDAALLAAFAFAAPPGAPGCGPATVSCAWLGPPPLSVFVHCPGCCDAAAMSTPVFAATWDWGLLGSLCAHCSAY